MLFFKEAVEEKECGWERTGKDGRTTRDFSIFFFLFVTTPVAYGIT